MVSDDGASGGEADPPVVSLDVPDKFLFNQEDRNWPLEGEMARLRIQGRVAVT